MGFRHSWLRTVECRHFSRWSSIRHFFEDALLVRGTSDYALFQLWVTKLTLSAQRTSNGRFLLRDSKWVRIIWSFCPVVGSKFWSFLGFLAGNQSVPGFPAEIGSFSGFPAKIGHFQVWLGLVVARPRGG